MECPPTRRSARKDLYLTEEILDNQSDSGEFLRHGSLTTTNVFFDQGQQVGQFNLLVERRIRTTP